AGPAPGGGTPGISGRGGRVIHEKKPRRPPFGRVTILSMLAIAYALVLLPVALATDWTFGPILVGAGSFAIAIAAVWRRTTFGGSRPRPIDLVVGEVHALSFVVVTGLLWMGAYASTYWPVRGLGEACGDGTGIHE